MKFIISLLIITFGQFAFSQIDHSEWDKLLKQNVSKNGLIDYQAIKNQPEKLNLYLRKISSNPPEDNWPENEKKAYWINVYNAFTVKLIIDNYPIKSIKDIAGRIYKVNTPWDIKFIKIGKETYDLNNIEHNILRKDFDDPRIHFAINCASISCPNIRNEAYKASDLENQLNEQAILFINDTTKNTLSKEKVQLSKIFQWFKGDFTKASTLINYINKYSKEKISESATVEFLAYDWNLNIEK
jgi:hypothetical protein